MASQTEAPQSLQALSAESSLALNAGGASAGGVDAGNGNGPVAEVRSVDNGAAAAIRIDADLKSPDLFLNRELTWLAFNRRVFAEAVDDGNPLLERVKFLAITASNLDEFFMKRIGGLKQQAIAGMQELTDDGRTPQQQIAECLAEVRQFEAGQRALLPVLLKRLSECDIHVLSFEQLTAAEQSAIRDYYLRNIFPLMTPQTMDPAHPFPFISNLSLNLLVTLRAPDDAEPSLARVKVPVGRGIPRFLRVDGTRRFVPLEDVVAHTLDLLFPDARIDGCEFFRVTRNANTERDEDEADDLLALIESELRDRRFAPIVRMEAVAGMLPAHRGMLAAELGLDERDDVFEIDDGMLAMRDLMELTAVDNPALHDPPHHPADHARLASTRSIFHVIREAGSILLMHPYESFPTSVGRFLREASEDPKVRAIKMTLYRTSGDSEVIGYLCDAARNGKQVAVVVELKARFDEAANIHFAEQLEEYGIHVTYGVVGLKTHCKVILVVRQDYNGLRRYSHIGTGNYHAGTARLYADFGLLTNDDAVGADLTQLFNFLTTGYRAGRTFKKILPAPALLKKALLERIDREIRLHRAGTPGLIQMKMNALEDVDITRALYRAGQAGVKVDLIVRDTCRLRPGIPGLSESVRVVSIVGRFLEHGRIYYFRNGGAEEYFIGSADCMKRNLESRVEAVAPVEDPALRKELRAVFDAQLKPNHAAWEMRSDGSYVRLPGDPKSNCQLAMIDIVERREKEEEKARRRRKGFARRVLK
jgi:polyphosphate kinase